MIDMSNMQTRMKKTSAKSTFSNKDPRLSQSIHYAILLEAMKDKCERRRNHDAELTFLMQVDQLKEENVRLQEESQTAAQQLRRFTEWFFQTIDKS